MQPSFSVGTFPRKAVTSLWIKQTQIWRCKLHACLNLVYKHWKFLNVIIIRVHNCNWNQIWERSQVGERPSGLPSPLCPANTALPTNPLLCIWERRGGILSSSFRAHKSCLSFVNVREGIVVLTVSLHFLSCHFLLWPVHVMSEVSEEETEWPSVGEFAAWKGRRKCTPTLSRSF